MIVIYLDWYDCYLLPRSLRIADISYFLFFFSFSDVLPRNIRCIHIAAWLYNSGLDLGTPKKVLLVTLQNCLRATIIENAKKLKLF